MNESFPDEQETIECTLLLSDIKDIFETHSNTSGVQMFDGEEYEHGNVVLTTDPNDTYALTIWGKWKYGVGVIAATIIYQEKPSGRETHTYDVEPGLLTQYSNDPTSLDEDDIQKIRLEVGRAEWHREASEALAHNAILFNPSST